MLYVLKCDFLFWNLVIQLNFSSTDKSHSFIWVCILPDIIFKHTLHFFFFPLIWDHVDSFFFPTKICHVFHWLPSLELRHGHWVCSFIVTRVWLLFQYALSWPENSKLLIYLSTLFPSSSTCSFLCYLYVFLWGCVSLLICKESLKFNIGGGWIGRLALTYVHAMYKIDN